MVPTPSPGPLPGWYGKLPALGDFASRRLPPEFIEPWDRWLASELARWRESDPSWLDAFLVAPPCRFALGPGLPSRGSRGLAGVLMPSVDRVGRYFPLTIVRPRGAGEVQVPVAWLKAVEGVAVAALQQDWDAPRLDAELAALGDGGGDGGGDVASATLWSGWIDVPEWPAPGSMLWWRACGSTTTEPTLLRGLPEDEAFARLFAGLAA